MTELAAVPSIGRAAAIEPTADAVGSAALGRLYENHSQQVFRFCLGLLRKRDEAEDAAQTTFLYALRALRRGVVPVSESAWLLKIARNVCLNRFDSARRRGTLELVQDPQVLAEISPARSLDEVDVDELRAALLRLPARQRQAILLREWQGLSYAEIGEELGLSTSAVETLLFRARRALARDLGGDERRRGADLAGMLGWLKALLGGGAAKIAVGAAVVATVGVVAPMAVESSRDAPAVAARPVAAAHAPFARAAPAVAPLAGTVPGSRRPVRAALPAAPVRVGAAPAAPAVRPVPSGAATEPRSAPAAAPREKVALATPAAAAPASTSEATPIAQTPAPPALPVSAPSLPDPTQALTTTVEATGTPDPTQVVQTVVETATTALPEPPSVPPLPAPAPPPLPQVDTPPLP